MLLAGKIGHEPLPAVAGRVGVGVLPAAGVADPLGPVEPPAPGRPPLGEPLPDPAPPTTDEFAGSPELQATRAPAVRSKPKTAASTVTRVTASEDIVERRGAAGITAS